MSIARKERLSSHAASRTRWAQEFLDPDPTGSSRGTTLINQKRFSSFIIEIHTEIRNFSIVSVNDLSRSSSFYSNRKKHR